MHRSRLGGDASRTVRRSHESTKHGRPGGASLPEQSGRERFGGGEREPIPLISAPFGSDPATPLPDTVDLAPVRLAMGLVRVTAQQAPEAGVLNAKDFRRRVDAHLIDEQQRPSFKEKGEAATGTRPGNVHLMHPALGAIGSRNRGDNFGFILPEIEMTPAPLSAVVDAALLPATWTGKPLGSLLEVSDEGDLFRLAFKRAGSHRPRVRHRKGSSKKLPLIHAPRNAQSRLPQRPFAPVFTQNSEHPGKRR